MEEAQRPTGELVDGLQFLSREDLIEHLTRYILMDEDSREVIKLLAERLKETEARYKHLAELCELGDLVSFNKEKLNEKIIEYTNKKMRSEVSNRARSAASALHDQRGGSREKRNAILEIWTSGKYSSRDLCAEQECAALGMSYSTARKALIGTPDPT